jgi:hypothetical protein
VLIILCSGENVAGERAYASQGEDNVLAVTVLIFFGGSGAARYVSHDIASLSQLQSPSPS